MIDIHTHLLPGVDDGSPSIGASRPVLERFAAEGVETLVCTPHLKATRAATAPFDEYRQIFDELVAAVPPVPRLLLGWEIMLDAPGLNLTDRRLALGGSTAVLVEFTRHLPGNTTAELARLARSGIVPVVAHPERYRECTPELVTAWRSVGAVMQMDVPSIFGSQRLSSLAEALLSEGLIDLFSSDTHVDTRSLGFAKQWLSDLAPPEAVDLLTRENARRLLAGEPVLPVPPIRLHRGMFQRLRELVLSRAPH